MVVISVIIMMSLFGPSRLSSSGDASTGIEENGGKKEDQECDWSTKLESSSPVALKCAPITLYTSEAFDGNGSQIGACEAFVCYAIKGGKVRILNRISAARTLLRGHESTISDLAFGPYEAETGQVLMASADANGCTLVWRLSATDGDDIPCVHIGSLEGSRVAWRQGSKDDEEPATSHGAALTFRKKRIVTRSDILDLRWNASKLVVLGADQVVSTFDEELGQIRAGSVQSPCRQVAIMGDDTVVALSDDALCIDWRRHLPFPSGSEGRRRLAVVDDLLLVSCGSSLRVAHVSKGSVDFVTEWTFGGPISSWACLKTPLTGVSEDAEADAETLGFEIQLFCVQPKAIQQFFLRPSTCYPVPAPAAPPIVPQEVVAEASREAVETQWQSVESRLERIEGSVARLEAAHDIFAAALAPAVEAAVTSIFAKVDSALRDRLETYERLQSQRLEKLDELIAAAVAQGSSNSLTNTPMKKGGRIDYDDEDDVAAANAADEDQRRDLPAEEDQREVLKQRIAELASEGEYDGAVYKAVEASDVDVLLFALTSVSDKNVATMHPLPFQQLTLLCVVQQLAATLHQHPDHLNLKLDWIQLSVLALDMSDVQIASHVPEVLRQLNTAIDNLPQQIKAQQQIAILTHIVHSLLNIY